ncbi:conserved hypothetical protein [Beggiatoa sp. PS]|nr:conserved hypothetical protein [Beggiatoa sp. PS]
MKYIKITFWVFGILIVIGILWWLLSMQGCSNNKTPSKPQQSPETRETQSPQVQSSDETSVPIKANKENSEENLPKPEEKIETPSEFLTKPKQSLSQQLMQENPQQYYELLKEENTEVLWQRWMELLENNQNVAEQTLLTHALVYKLRKGGEDEIYMTTKALLRQDIPTNQKSMIIGLLGEAATKGAIKVLLNTALDNSEPVLQPKLNKAISRIGDKRWNNQFHTELSPYLETAWLEVTNDGTLVSAIAKSLAKVGSPNGIDLLMKTFDDAQDYPDDINRAAIVKYSMRHVRNPEAIPNLAANLQSYQLENQILLASGDALAAMGNVKATGLLLEWATDAPIEANAFTDAWFRTAMAHDPHSIDFLVKEMPSQKFKNENIKQTILNILSEQLSYRK